MKILCWDIETSNLNADFGIVLCVVVRTIDTLTNKTDVIRIDEFPLYKNQPWNDKIVLTKLKKILDDADIWVTYNGRNFDVPFVNSRLLFHGMQKLANVKHLDLYQIAKWKLKLHSKRADVVAEFLQCKHQKSPMKGEQWTKALCGVKSAMDYIVKHCIEDVDALVDLLDKMRGLIEYIK